jgi:hypothetical protein
MFIRSDSGDNNTKETHELRGLTALTYKAWDRDDIDY